MSNEKEAKVEVVKASGSEGETYNEKEFVLRTPVIDGDKRIEKLTLDFDSLDGDDMLRADNMALELAGAEDKAMTLIKATSLPYQMALVALAVKLPIEVVKKINAKDLSKLCTRAQNFLLS